MKKSKRARLMKMVDPASNWTRAYRAPYDTDPLQTQRFGLVAFGLWRASAAG